jgi:hypothetical protein
VGSAAQDSGGQLRFGLSATVASAVLYSAVVLLGPGPASPSAQGREADRSSPVVRVPRDPAVSRPGSRLPHVSSGRTRRTSQRRGSIQREQKATVTAAPTAGTDGGKSSPAPPRTPEAKPKATTSSTSVVESAAPPTATTPTDPDPVVTVPQLPVTVPDLPVTVPTMPVPLPPVPPVQVPTVPSLPLP